MSRDTESFHWSAFNPSYGTWYRLERVANGVRVGTLIPGYNSEVLVQPDMEPGRWYWSVTITKSPKRDYKPRRMWGTMTTDEDARYAAMDAFLKMREE